jgi:ABC-type nitrate/sulfonate/bicarbonate transport system substrate-binding protein
MMPITMWRVGALAAVLCVASMACTSPASPTAPTAARAPVAPTAATASPPAPPAASPTAELERVVVTTSDPNIAFGPLYVGIAKGFYREEGLDPQPQVIRADASLAALATGQDVDYQTTAGTVARGAAKGLPVKIVGLWYEKVVFFLIARPEIRTIQDLRGKVLGVTTYGASIDVVLRRLLRDNGIDPDTDVSIIQLGAGTGRLAAIAQGAAVATLFNPPDNLIAEEYGLHRIPSAAEEVPLPFTGLGTSDRKLQEQPGQVERMLRATLKTLRFMRAQPLEASDIIAEAVGADRDLTRRALENLAPTISPDAWASQEAIERQLEEGAEPGAPPPPQSAVFAPGPLKAAQQALGISGRP